MTESKTVIGFVFAAFLLLSPVFCPKPAVAEPPDSSTAETRKITLEASSQPAGSIQLAVDKAVPSAIQVKQTDPGEADGPAEKPAAQKQAEKPSEAKEQDAAKAAPQKPAKTAPTDAPPMKQAEDGKPSPADFLKAEDTTILPAVKVKPDAGQQQAAAPVAAAGTDDILKVKPESALFGPIERNIGYFSNTIKKHFTQWLARSGRYLDLMKGILRENYVPEDLVFLALIESGFNPKAYSFARASGPWQFIKGTAVRYGLKVDRWVDERRDPIKSTKAAAAYLKDLYDMFGSWPLAMASYNCGEGNILRAVKRNDTEDFWELRKTRSIPSETKDYVPKFVAAQMIATDPQQYGFDDLKYEKPFEFEEVKVTQCISLATAAKCCEAPENELKDLNPELLRGCTPPNRAEYTLRVPKGTKETFLKNYAALPDSEKTVKIAKERGTKRYVARKGDTLKSVARKYDVSVATLAKANRLRASARLRRGQRIRIPVEEETVVVASNAAKAGEAETETVKDETKTEAKAEAKAEDTEAKAEATGDSEKPRHSQRAETAYYKVRKGDTLARIASRHGTSVAELVKLNHIRVKTRVRPGQRLALSRPHAEEKVASAEPDRKAASAKKRTHKKAVVVSRKTYRVKRGDTLYSIAKRFRVSREKLAQVNSISGSSIHKGQKLVIPDEGAA